MKYNFEKPIIAPHTLAEQLKAAVKRIEERHEAEWADTVPTDEAEERLVERGDTDA